MEEKYSDIPYISPDHQLDDIYYQKYHSGRRKTTSASGVDWLFRTFFQHPVILFICAFVYLFVLFPSPARCQTAPDLCNATNAAMCMNNATCEPRVYDFKCNCGDPEFTGWYCNVSARQSCNKNPCSRGSCSDTLITIGANSSVPSFNCTCPPGYDGPLCEKAIDYCNINGMVCGNNGQCVNHPEHQNYTCICDTASDFEGVNCTTVIDNCSGVSCGRGTCLDGLRNYTCICYQDYTGQVCKTLIDPCQNMSDCQHGKCENGQCNCKSSGWEGPHCEIEVNECEVSNHTCLHGGSCNNTEGSFDCTCTLGYEGKTCQNPNCTGVCQNGATCIIESREWRCNCPQYIEGDVCDMIGLCYYSPCEDDNNNTVSCEQSIEYNNYTCNCNSGWRGQNCSEDINECNETDPNLREKCVNGTCDNLPGSYKCNCFDGYKGAYCDEEINECDSLPCKNNGLCTDLINNFTCDCSGTGFEGRQCEMDIDECEKDPDICHDGQCNNTVGSYVCDCGDMYLGKHCEEVNPCNNTLCYNNGVCVYNQTTDGKYVGHCRCVDEYEGPLCEKKPRSEESNDDEDLGVIIGPIVGGVLFIIIIIVIIAFVMTARSKRATRGAYSPSQQETSGSRVELGNVLKKPPEERLI